MSLMIILPILIFNIFTIFFFSFGKIVTYILLQYFILKIITVFSPKSQLEPAIF